MKLRYIYILLSVFCLGLTACSKDGDDDIEAYIMKKNLDAKVTEEGLYYVVEAEGNLAKKPKINSDVIVSYTGTLLDDKQFDSSTNFKTNLSNVIAGWRRGMPLFGEGGKGILIIPPSLGYGDTAVGDIPANSALVFKFEIKEVLN